MKLDRLGVQIGLWQYACVNAVPVSTNWSIVGVRTDGFPNAPMVSNRCWSVQYQRMLGRSNTSEENPKQISNSNV